jgi:hypothetical protein
LGDRHGDESVAGSEAVSDSGDGGITDESEDSGWNVERGVRFRQQLGGVVEWRDEKGVTEVSGTFQGDR